MNSENEFPLSWDGLIKGMTAAVFVLLATLVVIFRLALDNIPLVVGILSLFACVLLMPLLWAPQGYALMGNVVTVRRRIGDVKIRVAKMPERWTWTWWGLRLFGSGGLYGYFGYFMFKGIGRVHMYATNRHNLVLLADQKGGKVLVSPNDPENFVHILRESLRFSDQRN
jgi:hypothetical protein